MWAFNQGAWSYREILVRLPVPDPYFADIVLFFHMVPMIAAVAWRPDFQKKQSKLQLSSLNFLLLLAWWVFLYAFLVFPDQYVVLNVTAYDRHYDALYAVESLLLALVLGLRRGPALEHGGGCTCICWRPRRCTHRLRPALEPGRWSTEPIIQAACTTFP